MIRRVGAPGALAEQRGPGKRKAASPLNKEKRPSQSASSSRGSSNGRTPALTSAEMSGPNPACPESATSGTVAAWQRRPRIKTPGLSPEAMTTQANIAVSTLFFQSPASGRPITWIEPMNFLSREKQIEVIAALCDGLGIRAACRITGVNRGTVGALALRMGRGCAELHDRMMVGLRTSTGASSMSYGAMSARSKSTSTAKTLP